MIHPVVSGNPLATPHHLRQRDHRWVAPTIRPPHLRNHPFLQLSLKSARLVLTITIVFYNFFHTFYFCLGSQLTLSINCGSSDFDV